MKLHLLISILLFSTYGYGQRTIYHKYQPHASGFRLLKWNINPDSMGKWYIEENVDSKGRVTELKFFENDSVDCRALCYLSTWITYDYPNDTTVIEYELYCDSSKFSAYPCEVGWKTTYHMDENLIIKEIDFDYYWDKERMLNEGWKQSNIEKHIQKFLNSSHSNPSLSFIDFYPNSYAKYNGRFPHVEGYKLEGDFNSLKAKTIQKILRTE